jgi:uncharacterized protein YecE (DUF72 family)
VLFQLPPTLRLDLDRLRGLLAVLPTGLRPAVEFRERSWQDERVYEALERAGAALVLADRPGARVPEVVTGGWSYVRFHQGRYSAAGYPREKLRRWAERLAAMAERASEVYVYFNNDPGGAAVRDAFTLTDLLTRLGCEVRGPRGPAVG